MKSYLKKYDEEGRRKNNEKETEEKYDELIRWNREREAKKKETWDGRRMKKGEENSMKGGGK